MTDPTRSITREPRTTAGREMLSRTRTAAGALNALLQRRGVEGYDLSDWAPSLEEIAAIEDEAAVLPGITRDQLATVIDKARRSIESPWYVDFPATRDRVADAILAALPRSAAPALDVERLEAILNRVYGPGTRRYQAEAISREYARLASRSDASGEGS